MLPILLKHPLCSLGYVSTAYYITSNYFHEPTVTGNMLKIRLIELGGKDPDEFLDDDNSSVSLWAYIIKKQEYY